MAGKSTDELAPSELGTHDYWERTYSQEINNFVDHGDFGEVWFGSDNSKKVVSFIATKLNLSKDTDKIIDLGCGNGVTLVNLADAGFKLLTGIDYSSKGIELAKKVLDKEGYSDVELLWYDILEPPNSLQVDNFKFKLAHDKGTYDAISLCADHRKEARETYIKNVHEILVDGGYLALTSCNWTKDELIQHFKKYFELTHVLPTKLFSFGGQKGSNITQLIFTKK